MKKRTRVDEQERQGVTAGPDDLCSERWERLGAANEAARRERLRALTVDGAIREFEDLCRQVHTAFDEPLVARPHPVGLVKYTRGEHASR